MFARKQCIQMMETNNNGATLCTEAATFKRNLAIAVNM